MHLAKALVIRMQMGQQSTINLSAINFNSLSNCLKRAVRISFSKLLLRINIPLSVMETVLRNENRGGYI